MKSVVISLVIAVIIVGGSLLYTNHLEKVSEDFSAINENISRLLETEEYSSASSQIEHLISYLDRKRPMLAATGNHEELDKIEMNLSELAEYAKGEKQTDALSSCRVLGFLFEHLPKNYKLKLENIL